MENKKNSILEMSSLLGGTRVTNLHFVLYDSEQAETLAVGFFDSSQIKVQSIGSSLASVERSNMKVRTDDKQIMLHAFGHKVIYKHLYDDSGYTSYHYGLALSDKLGKEYLVTNEERAKHDFGNFLFENSILPLDTAWEDYLWDYFVKSTNCKEVTAFCGSDVLLSKECLSMKDLKVYRIAFTEEFLEEAIQKGLQSGKIRMGTKPVAPFTYENMDQYIADLGSELVTSIKKQIKPLIPLKGTVDGLALKTSRLYPQQAAVVNGAIALIKKVSYALLVCGMGTGKTKMGLSIVEAFYNNRWLKKHPDKTLKDCFESKEVSYRVILMCPSHLCQKWVDETLSEIPDAKCMIIDRLEQLADIRRRGKDRNGKEFYFMSMDFAKLGSMLFPTPFKRKAKRPVVNICWDCMTKEVDETDPLLKKLKYQTMPWDHRDMDTLVDMAGGKRRIMTGRTGEQSCPCCGSTHSHPAYVFGDESETAVGLCCPHCDNLLMRYTSRLTFASDIETIQESNVMDAEDFASASTANECCYACGKPLWGMEVKNKRIFLNGRQRDIERKPRWYKITHYTNQAKKGKTTAFILEDKMQYNLERYLSKKSIPFQIEEDALLDDYHTRMISPVEGSFSVSNIEYGARKYSPAQYIKKYLKGYFDFCILDEVHKFAGHGTARATAAHACIKASKYTVGLTGTISNGMADSFFSLLYKLEPSRMKERGFDCDAASIARFINIYGSTAQRYEYKEHALNKSSRGRAVGVTRVKPGISPLLYIDFLLDRALFLDLTDMSKFLPELHEEVVTCPMPEEVGCSYHKCIDILRSAGRDYSVNLDSTALQFGLSYPDKPWGRLPIVNPQNAKHVIVQPGDHSEYNSYDHLLPKEEVLCDIVSKELSENRNVFVYCTYTNAEETNITERLKKVLEKHCHIPGHVCVIKSQTPAAVKRELYIRQKASEGINVFICNCKLVETGLDFCFDYKGRHYNYPSIVFYQVSYELAVLWQASRRHYRLNQTEECRTYWLAYEGSLQVPALSIMAEKQVAANTIQGGVFSAEGLSAMASGVDGRVKLQKSLMEGDMGENTDISSMFDVKQPICGDTTDSFKDYVPPKTYYEVMGTSLSDVVTGHIDGINCEQGTFDFFEDEEMLDIAIPDMHETNAVTVPAEVGTFTFNGIFDEDEGFSYFEEDDGFDDFEDIILPPLPKAKKKRDRFALPCESA